MRGWVRLALLLIAIGLAPILSVLISSAIAGAAGCALNEGVVSPCPVAGLDIGGLLSTLFVAGWFMILSLPIGAAGIGLLLCAAGVALVRRLRR